MDIPFLGGTIGWRNYKFVAKKELEKVPILSAAIEVAGNLMVDRKDKRSGMKTLRAGIDYIKDGVHLCTFPEGTRSKNGRVMEFKNGAFKMAHKAGAPVIPLSIVGANVVQPPNWMFPLMACRKNTKVVVHRPVESKGISEEELAEKVRSAMIDGLPEDQKPLKQKN
jgi:1-acyl-sn-glycerol-3-phosphate acyltransferase